MPAFVLDTSAVLVLLNDEPGASEVKRLLVWARDDAESIIIWLPFMVLMELEYLMLRRLDPAAVRQVLATIQAWPVQLQESDEGWRHAAAQIKSRHSLSVADAWIAGLALMRDGRLVHQDPDYDAIPDLSAVRLPS